MAHVVWHRVELSGCFMLHRLQHDSFCSGIRPPAMRARLAPEGAFACRVPSILDEHYSAHNLVDEFSEMSELCIPHFS